jgi:hypothetical protein
MIFYNLTLPAFEGVPNDVRLADAIAPLVAKDFISANVYLCNGVSGGAGVFPAVGHVRAPDAYGPMGVEYTGTETLPAEAQVQLGVTYGADSTEFTGTLTGGGGKKRVRIVM